jgi:transcriptional regulator of heat shock response
MEELVSVVKPHLASDLADSTFIKLFAPMVLTVLVPSTGWFANKVFDKFEKLETSVASSAANAATSEYRLRQVETMMLKIEADNRAIRDRLNELTLRTELMDARRK